MHSIGAVSSGVGGRDTGPRGSALKTGLHLDDTKKG